MKNSFKITALALAVSVSFAACNGTAGNNTTDTSKADSSKTVDTLQKDTTIKSDSAKTDTTIKTVTKTTETKKK